MQSNDPDIELFSARAERLERANASLIAELKSARETAYLIEYRLTKALRPNSVSLPSDGERLGHILNTIYSMMEDLDVIARIARDIPSTKAAD